jgi:AcrR family transcriptional regulator
MPRLPEIAVTVKEQVRKGGRSARIQRAVHDAVHELGGLSTRNQITVPQIAAAAGVTPSTIYRRWGDLSALLADVAVARLRPIADPDDTGAVETDLRTFIEQYAEEMSSPVGRTLLRDGTLESKDDLPCVCCSFTNDHLTTITERAKARGETPFDLEEVIDHVVAPIVYRILVSQDVPTPDYCKRLIDRIYPPAPKQRAG